MNAADKRRLHPDDVALWLAVEAAVFRVANSTHTEINWVRPMKKVDTQQWWGMYHGHPEHGIEITLRDWNSDDGWSGKRQKLYQIIEVIAHELAHRKVGIRASHNNAWFLAYARFLEDCALLNIRLDLLNCGVTFPPE